ncbi:hypothetical protein BTVI_127238 [Pitangus sulphuratus]|nr:hypothetical protein BTVI_127238 [Pitangus sulphuratus]
MIQPNYMELNPKGCRREWAGRKNGQGSLVKVTRTLMQTMGKLLMERSSSVGLCALNTEFPCTWHWRGYYVMSYGLTHVFLEVMGFLDSIQRINEDSVINKGFERTLLFTKKEELGMHGKTLTVASSAAQKQQATCVVESKDSALASQPRRHKLLEVRGPKLNTVFKVWPHQHRVLGDDQFCRLAINGYSDASGCKVNGCREERVKQAA